MGGSLSLLLKKLDKKRSDKGVWKCGCDPCRCDPCECANDDKQKNAAQVCSSSGCPCDPCTCDPCDCETILRDMQPYVNIESIDSEISNQHSILIKGEILESSESSSSETIIWSRSMKSSPMEEQAVKKKCGQCTCDDCICVECVSKEYPCNTSKASDVSVLAAKFNPDIQETHLKCAKQNGCPCDPCPCYPFKCQPQQLRDEEPLEPNSEQLEVPPVEQLAEQLEKLTVDPSVESDAGVVSDKSDNSIIESQETQPIDSIINGESNGVIVASNY